MKNKLEYMRGKLIKLSIDGFCFDKPKTWSGDVLLGMLSILVIISLPVWVIPYLMGKFIAIIAKRVEKPGKIFFCSECNYPITKIGDLQSFTCENCGYDSYLDFHEHKERKSKR